MSQDLNQISTSTDGFFDNATAQVDLFGNSHENYPTIVGGLKFNGKAVMAFKDGRSYAGMIIQNYQVQYQQTVTKLRGLNTSDVFTVIAPPTGSAVFNSALTGALGYYRFCREYGNACNTQRNHIQISGLNSGICGLENSGQATQTTNTVTRAQLMEDKNDMGANLPELTLKGCLVSQVQIAQNIENLVMTSQLMMEFVALDAHGQTLTNDPAFQGQTSGLMRAVDTAGQAAGPSGFGTSLAAAART